MKIPNRPSDFNIGLQLQHLQVSAAQPNKLQAMLHLFASAAACNTSPSHERSHKVVGAASGSLQTRLKCSHMKSAWEQLELHCLHRLLFVFQLKSMKVSAAHTWSAHSTLANPVSSCFLDSSYDLTPCLTLLAIHPLGKMLCAADYHFHSQPISQPVSLPACLQSEFLRPKGVCRASHSLPT